MARSEQALRCSASVKIKRLRARYIYAAALATAILLIFAAASFERSLAQLLGEMRRTSATNSHLLLLDALLSDTKDVERGSSGFVITHDDAFLQPFDKGSQALAADSAAIARSLRSDPHASAEFEQAEADAGRFLALSQRIVRLEQSGSSARATQAISSRAQLQLAERIESTVTGLTQAELDELAMDQGLVRQETRRTVLFGLAALAMTLVMLTIVVMAMRREIVRRTASRNAASEANQQLTERVDELNRRSAEAALLSELSEMLHVSDGIEEVQRMLPEFGARLFPEIDGALYTIDANSIDVAAWWRNEPEVRSFTASDCWALRLGRPHFASPDITTLRCRHTANLPADVTLCVPMLAQGEALGILSLHGTREAFGSDSVEKLARSVADQMSLGLANLRLHETLRTRAMRDPLTGLFNRRYMGESLARCIQTAQKQRGQFGVIMLDVDHFKRYNDTFGHAGGDAALQHLANCMTEHFRDTDILCRFGGEEFFVIMPDANLEIATRRAEELRSSVRGLDVRLKGQALSKFTISAGAAVFPDHARDASSLIAAVDAALYEAKRLGRDRVVPADHPRQELIAV